MNYLAHLYLAQPTSDSYYGNLLGDFRQGGLPGATTDAVLAGVQNHLLVDKFTDSHPLVRDARRRFSRRTRRFSGVALDVVFDHYLITAWSQHHAMPFAEFKRLAYTRLSEKLPVMPPVMQQRVSAIINQDWFGHYASLDGTLQAISNIARRVRFANEFATITDELANNDRELRETFTAFFPELVAEVNQQALEQAHRV